MSALEDRRRAEYRRLFEEVLEASLLKSIRDATNGGYPLVSDAYKSRMTGYRTERGKPGPRAEAPAPCYKNYDPDPEFRLAALYQA